MVKITRVTRTTTFSAAIVTLMVAGSVLGLAAPAQAHNYLVSSTPAVGSTLTALPDQFSVTTNGPLPDLSGNGSGFGIQIIDSQGLFYGDGCVNLSGPTVATTAAIGAPGTYHLVWQVISTDSHPVSGEFTFTWAPKGSYTASRGSTRPGNCHGLYARSAVTATSPAVQPDSTPIALIDVLWIGGTVVAVGLAIFIGLMLFRPRLGRED